MKTLATFLLSIVLPVCGQVADDAIVSTMGKGVGVTAEEALKDSFRDAVERAVGVFVDAEAQAENDQLIHDQVLTHSNAYIEKYRTVSERKLENGLLEVKIVAEVKKGELTQKLRDTMPEKMFSLGDELKRKYEERQQLRLELDEQRRQESAREISKEKRDADAVALVKSTLADLNPTAMMIDIAALGTKPTVNETDGETTVGFDLRMALSQEKYHKTLVPRLKQLFGQITLKEPQVVRFILSNASSQMTPSLAFRCFREERNMSMLAIPADSIWERSIEINGSPCKLPECRFIRPVFKEICGRDSPNVWIVDRIQGSAPKMRVSMTGYVLAEDCYNALADVVDSWDKLPAVEYMVELVDSSDETITSQNLRVLQALGWIGFGDDLKSGKSFYVMPWYPISGNVKVKTRLFGGVLYDENGNALGKVDAQNMILKHLLSQEVRMRCTFKILEEELKSAAAIRVRAADK
jgi:hypothetical protein